MLYPVSELETVSPLGSESPAVGPGLGLDWKELKAVAFVLLPGTCSHTAADRKMDSTPRA